MSKLPIYIIFTITYNSLFGNIYPWVISYPQGDYTSINKDSFNIDLISKPILACYKPDGISDSLLNTLSFSKFASRVLISIISNRIQFIANENKTNVCRVFYNLHRNHDNPSITR